MIDYSLLYNSKMATDERKIWYFSEQTGYVMEIEIKTGRMECLFFAGNNTEQYRIIYYFQDKLFLLPFNSNVLIIYKIKKKQLSKVVLSESTKKCRCTGCACLGNALYVFGETKIIYKFDMESEKLLKVIDLERQGLPIIRPEKNEPWFWVNPVIYNDKLYLLMFQNEIIVIDENDEIANIHLGEGHRRIVQKELYIEKDVIRILCTDSDLNIRQMSFGMAGDLLSDNRISADYSWDVYPYLRSENVRNGWIVFPFLNTGIRWIDGETFETNIIYDIENAGVIKDKECYGAEVVINNNEIKIATIDLINGKLLIIDVNSRTVESKDLFFDEEGKNNYRHVLKEEMKKGSFIVHETKELGTIDLFLKAVTGK